MEKETIRFDELHTSNTLPNYFSPELSSAWQASRRFGVPYQIPSIPALPLSRLETLKSDSIKLYAYANHCIARLPRMIGEDVCLALFNASGILLKLYGGEKAKANLEDGGISRLSDWSMRSIGANAVNIGLFHNKPMTTVSTENYAFPLADKAIYFAPCCLEKNNFPNILGGIAAITSADKAHPSFLALCESLSCNTDLHMFTANNFENTYSNDERGVLSIDFNMTTGKRYAIYHSQNLFDILNIPHSDIAFQPLENLISPLPANEQFWNIINSEQVVFDTPIPLSIQGRTDNYLITTEPYVSRHLCIHGMRIFFTSPKRLSYKISSVIGNNAIYTFRDLIGKTSSFEATVNQAKVFAKMDKNIMIRGESGTGRTMFAQAIHNVSSRSNGPFIPIDCASVPRDQLSNELFGYEDPTDHRIQNIGKFELAHKGTIFLNNIDVLPLDIQASLIRIIEMKSFFRSGGNSSVHLDVRIITTFNENILKNIEEHKFRADLYYRLNTLSLLIPALRDRKQDIPLLAEHFMKTLCQKNKIESKHFSPDAKKVLQKYPWSGNIRELQSVTESITFLVQEPYIEPEHIFEYLNDSDPAQATYVSHSGRYRVTREELQRTLQACHYNKQLAAEKLGISRRTLYRYLEKFQIAY